MKAKQSLLFYCAQVCVDAFGEEMYCNCLVQLQRREASGVVSAYRNATEAVVMVVAGVTPVTLLVKEPKKIYKCKGSWLLVKNNNIPQEADSSCLNRKNSESDFSVSGVICARLGRYHSMTECSTMGG